MKRVLPWVLAAVVSAGAAAAVVHHGTPIDRALPLIAAAVIAIAAISHPAVQAGVPLLIGGAIAFPDERLRLTWFGLVLGVVFACAILRGANALLLTIAAIVLLRWIPLSEVLIVRELVLIVIAVATVIVFRSTPLAIALAVAVALFTPAVPLRTLAFPMAVLIAGALLRMAGMPELRMPVLAAASMAVMMTFFAWSGAFARGLPILIRGVPAAPPRQPVHVSVGPGETKDLAVPADAASIIVSGANVPRLKRGALLGYVEWTDGRPRVATSREASGRSAVRVGDAADWGILRREHFLTARYRWPHDPAGLLRGYGQTAWIDGAGRVPLPSGARFVYVSGGPTLDFDARLQVDAFELRQR